LNLSQFAGYTPEKLVVKESREWKHLTDKGFLIDGLSGLYNVPLGFCRPELADTARAALAMSWNHNFNVYPGLEMTSDAQMELNDTLETIMPFMSKTFYTNSGSEAVDAAIRMCRSGKRRKVLSFSNSYHGSTDLAFKASGNLTPTSASHLRFPFFGPDYPRSRDEWLQEFEDFLKKHGPELACVIAEPCIGSGGAIFMRRNVLPEIQKMTHGAGAYFILDEVITGFGRLGTWFAWEKYGVIPDVLILSKAITNGTWPLSVVMTRDGLNEPNYGFTSAAHPVGCAIALKTLKLLDTAISRVHVLGEGYDHMLGYTGALPSGVVYRREGLMIGLHLYDKEGKRFPKALNVGAQIAKKALKRGLIVRGNPLSVIVAPMFMDYVDGHSPHAAIAFHLKEAVKETMDEHL
jgi:adenosylmethionine-8-amino-7-oxononanoate aminotransferase